MLRDFNARLHTRFATEEHRLGEYIFGYTSAEPHPESNRQLLLELCGALDLVVGNTFFAQPPSRQVTVYNVGSNPYSALIPANFGQINFILTNTEASRHSFHGSCAGQLSALHLAQIGHWNGTKYFINGMFE